jgi:protein disulfide-isomerase
MESRRPKEVGFAWIDGVFWQRWLKTTYGVDVKNGEQVLINDQDVSLRLEHRCASYSELTFDYH